MKYMYNKKHKNHKLSTYCHGLINQDLHLSNQKLVKKKLKKDRFSGDSKVLALHLRGSSTSTI